MKKRIIKGLPQNTYNKLYMRKYRDKMRKEKRCVRCYKPLENNYRKYCDVCLSKESKRNKEGWKNHREKELERGRTKHYNYKMKALKTISGTDTPVCVKCGYSDMRALTINHKNGDGNKDVSRVAGIYILVARGKRKIDDLEIMCQNCNRIFEYERGRLKLPIHMRD